MNSKLTLVGAGPGDIELIAYKGIKALERADVILYDALVNPEMLVYARAEALKVKVGKRAGQPSFKQEKINQLIVSYALTYGEVVRLKGGDPFIFGRGYEEVRFAEKNGLPVEVIPGISSATGLTALHHIPLTRRGVADGFWVLTASKVADRFNKDIELAAHSNSTVVILMGVRKLPQIVAAYERTGQSELPVVIIQSGSIPGEKVVEGTIQTILSSAHQQQVQAPAVIVIGEAIRQKTPQQLIEATVDYLN